MDVPIISLPEMVVAHLFEFSPLWFFKCVLNQHAKSHWSQLFDFSPLCVFKESQSIFIIRHRPHTSHTNQAIALIFAAVAVHCSAFSALHFFDFSPLCVFKWVSKHFQKISKHFLHKPTRHQSLPQLHFSAFFFCIAFLINSDLRIALNCPSVVPVMC